MCQWRSLRHVLSTGRWPAVCQEPACRGLFTPRRRMAAACRHHPNPDRSRRALKRRCGSARQVGRGNGDRAGLGLVTVDALLLRSMVVQGLPEPSPLLERARRGIYPLWFWQPVIDHPEKGVAHVKLLASIGMNRAEMPSLKRDADRPLADIERIDDEIESRVILALSTAAPQDPAPPTSTDPLLQLPLEQSTAHEPDVTNEPGIPSPTRRNSCRPGTGTRPRSVVYLPELHCPA